MHSSRIRTVRSSTVMRGGLRSVTETPSVDRITDACENITLPQTSFPGGKYGTFWPSMNVTI